MASFDRAEMARRIRKARRRAGLSQATLAEAAEITDETVSRIERRVTDPAISTMFALAQALGSSIDALVGPEMSLPGASEASVLLAERLRQRALQLDLPALRMLLQMAEFLRHGHVSSDIARDALPEAPLRYLTAKEQGAAAHEPRSTYGKKPRSTKKKTPERE